MFFGAMRLNPGSEEEERESPWARAHRDEEEAALGGPVRAKSMSRILILLLIWKHGGHSIDKLRKSCISELVGTQA